MTIGDLIALLERYPKDRLIVFEDCTDGDEFSYDHFEVFATRDSDDEVTLRIV